MKLEALEVTIKSASGFQSCAERLAVTAQRTDACQRRRVQCKTSQATERLVLDLQASDGDKCLVTKLRLIYGAYSPI